MKRSLTLAVVLAVAALPLDAQTPAERSISGDRMLADIRALSSDAFTGRAPGTAGEDSAVAYLSAQFKRIGLAAGNPAGGYIQRVPLVGTTSTTQATMTVKGQAFALKPLDDIVAWSMRPDPAVHVKASEIVFVGYGVVAPEFGWDDFKGVDVRGKTVVMLIGDPPVPDPADSTKLDPKVFRGNAMTYYGRWTYKFETAAARGAAAVLIVHQTGPAGYGWPVVQSNAHEKFDIARAPAHTPVEGWIHLDATHRLFAAAGQDFDALQRLARTRTFRPVSLHGTATIDVHNAVRTVQSRNVVGRIAGSDPAGKNEYIIYSAHWDAYGIGRAIGGDSIYNGALDDASGLAWLLETARAMKQLPSPPRRSILFLATTGEEQGLLGARYYGHNPLYPLARTVADINMDIMNVWGKTKSIVSLGYGQTSLEELLAREAARDGRTVKPDPESEKGYFYRADHFELARQGVPALSFLFPGDDYIGKPADYGAKQKAAYVGRDYHKPSDVVHPDWDMAGVVDDTRLFFRVGLDLASGSEWPTWNAGTEFRAAREKSLNNAGRPK